MIQIYWFQIINIIILSTDSNTESIFNLRKRRQFFLNFIQSGKKLCDVNVEVFTNIIIN
jgi:hypothetical protein